MLLDFDIVVEVKLRIYEMLTRALTKTSSCNIFIFFCSSLHSFCKMYFKSDTTHVFDASL
jgi:hypothetical protein